MKIRSLVLLCAAALVAAPAFAQDIPAGDDVWDTNGGGATDTGLLSLQWFELCGVQAADSTVLLKGFNLPGYGTGDTVVQRLEPAVFSGGASTVTVRIKLKDLSMVNEGSHPCSPLTLRFRADGTAPEGQMTITRTGTTGGTFSASVPVAGTVDAVDSAGNVVGFTTFAGVMNDSSPSPWSYTPPTGGAAQAGPWYPGVDPVTKAKVRVCRRGSKFMPARHCYWPRPKCKAIIVGTASPVSSDSLSATAIDIEPIEIEPIAVEPCFIQAQPVGVN